VCALNEVRKFKAREKKRDEYYEAEIIELSETVNNLNKIIEKQIFDLNQLNNLMLNHKEVD